ncbi:hypothetical protein E2C01_040195 [Portunus trituberculatus]|uniref:Uncharacterized protein n=1 Tax=Portunus trituberculatus TaxID=210409 RepID=A0A5B7FLZ0_PORTR|nr:hypothetical protein [Portunus trituberculatus]
MQLVTHAGTGGIGHTGPSCMESNKQFVIACPTQMPLPFIVPCLKQRCLFHPGTGVSVSRTPPRHAGTSK